MSTNTVSEQAVAPLLRERWKQVTQKLYDLADALPEDAFDKPLAPASRTCGEVVRHVAFWDHYVAESLSGKSPDGTANELPRDGYATKAEALGALRKSAAGVSAALDKQGGGESALAALLVPFLEHTSEHYGQLAVYARLLGITPPASR